MRRGLPFYHGLVFRLVQRVNLGSAVGAFDFDMFHGIAGQVFVALGGLVLPPDETAADHGNQQQQADNPQNRVGNACWLFDTPQPMDITALGVGTGELVELLDQHGLVDTQQFGIGADIAAGKGVPRQLVERAGFQVGQGGAGQIELEGHFRQRPTIAFAGLAQGFAWVDAISCYIFRVRGFHHCSDRYC